MQSGTANLNPSVPLCYSDRVTESLVCLLEKFCQMFDLVLLPLQLLLPFLIYHLQLYKPVHQILFAQIMDQAVDPITDTLATGLIQDDSPPPLAARRRLQVAIACFALSLLIISCLSSVSDTESPPRRGLPQPNCKSQGLTA